MTHYRNKILIVHTNWITVNSRKWISQILCWTPGSSGFYDMRKDVMGNIRVSYYSCHEVTPLKVQHVISNSRWTYHNLRKWPCAIIHLLFFCVGEGGENTLKYPVINGNKCNLLIPILFVLSPYKSGNLTWALLIAFNGIKYKKFNKQIHTCLSLLQEEPLYKWSTEK